MSWWVYLVDEDGESLLAPDGHIEGGTYPLGGTNLCELNVTYNYGRLLHGFGVHPDEWKDKTGLDTQESFERALNGLMDATHENECQENDYWHPCPENVARCVELLLAWAKYHPKGVWRVS